jgi:hypothetical protein
MTAPLSRRALLAATAGLIATPAPARLLDGPVAIEVAATPIVGFHIGDETRRLFGPLEFRGGLVLSARHPDFGGFSGLSLGADGTRLLAISDQGSWLEAELSYEQGRPSGLAGARLSPILDAEGKPLAATRAFDTEALCLNGGVAYIGIERVNQVLRFDFARHGVAARGRPLRLPESLRKLPFNRGLEAIGVASEGSPLAGALIAIAERSRSGTDAPTQGFILTGSQRGEFEVVRRDGFDVTDLCFLPGGDLLLLERWFSGLRGVAFRLRRIPAAGLKPQAKLDGPTLLTADMGYQIDNMEGVAYHRENSGAGIITLISDDNFNLLQRTILLQFKLAA